MQHTNRRMRSLLACASAIAVVFLFAGCEGGGDRVGSPAAPSPAADVQTSATLGSPQESPLKVETVAICHANSGTRSWVPIRVAPAALPAHLAHGDARVGDRVPGNSDARFDSSCAVTGGAVTITFAGLSSEENLTPFSMYTESGFTVSRVSGPWVVLTSYGAPAPAIVFHRADSEPTTSADVRVSAGGSTFTFIGVDLYSSITEIPYEFVGRVGGSVVFTTSGTVPNTFGEFVTVANPYASAGIDELTITLTNPATPCCSNPVGLDNVALGR